MYSSQFEVEITSDPHTIAKKVDDSVFSLMNLYFDVESLKGGKKQKELSYVITNDVGVETKLVIAITDIITVSVSAMNENDKYNVEEYLKANLAQP